MSSPLINRQVIDEIVNKYVRMSKNETTTIEIDDFGLFYEITEHPDFNKLCVPKINTIKNFGTGQRFMNSMVTNGISCSIIETKDDIPVGYFRKSQLNNVYSDIKVDGFFDFETQQRRINEAKLLTTYKIIKEDIIRHKNKINISTIVNNDSETKEGEKIPVPEKTVEEIALEKAQKNRNNEYVMNEYYDDEIDSLILQSSYVEKDENLPNAIREETNKRINQKREETSELMEINFFKVFPTVQRFCDKLLAKRRLALLVQRLYKNMLLQSEIRNSVFKLADVFRKYKLKQEQQKLNNTPKPSAAKKGGKKGGKKGKGKGKDKTAQGDKAGDKKPVKKAAVSRSKSPKKGGK